MATRAEASGRRRERQSDPGLARAGPEAFPMPLAAALRETARTGEL